VPLRVALEQEGLDPESDVTLVYFNKLGDMISALKTGQVDATSNTEPFMTEAVRQGWGHILGYYTEQWPDHPCCILFAQREFAEKYPDQLEKILQATTPRRTPPTSSSTWGHSTKSWSAPH